VDRRRTLSRLLASREPSIRLNTRLRVLGEDPESRAVRTLREQVRLAPRTRALLRTPLRPGRRTPWGIYHKWRGAHWALAHLAELGYPAGDESLQPMVDRVLDVWLRPSYFREFEATSQEEASRRADAVPRLNGRFRRCASQQGNALYACSTLGLAPEACDRLAERLLRWQWPDGGWNCDRDPGADTSSFGETLTPMVGLYVYGTSRRRPAAVAAARRASEVFLKRRLYRRVSDGRVIRPDFTALHYPLYWHYDLLGGLKAFARMGALNDARCDDALDLLESKELPHGGWPAERRFYDLPGERPQRGTDRVRWGALGPRSANEWVTLDALWVLTVAGRTDLRAPTARPG
jgi:ADP-ribose pyrophosphatase YjhB (NUDIX family)